MTESESSAEFSSIISSEEIDLWSDQQLAECIELKKKRIKDLERENAVLERHLLSFGEVSIKKDKPKITSALVSLSRRKQSIYISLPITSLLDAKKSISGSITHQLLNIKQKFHIAKIELEKEKNHEKDQLKSWKKNILDLQTEITEVDLKYKEIIKLKADFDRLFKTNRNQVVEAEKIKKYFNIKSKKQISELQNLQLNLMRYKLERKKINEEIRLKNETVEDLKKEDMDKIKLQIIENAGKIKLRNHILLKKKAQATNAKILFDKFIAIVNKVESEYESILKRISLKNEMVKKLCNSIYDIEKQIRDYDEMNLHLTKDLNNYSAIPVVNVLKQKERVKCIEKLNKAYERKSNLIHLKLKITKQNLNIRK